MAESLPQILTVFRQIQETVDNISGKLNDANNTSISKFKNEVDNFAKESMIELGAYADDLGVLATFENMPSFNTMIFYDMEELNEFLTSNGLYMTLDIGHANHSGYGADEMYFDCIKHVHIHDNFGDDDAHLTLGEGSIELNSIVNTLEKNNYDGIYIIEVNNYDSIKNSYEYMKKNF